MMDHLCNQGGALDSMEKRPDWDASEVPTLYFNQVENAMKQLT
jgi:hypothetical protein